MQIPRAAYWDESLQRLVSPDEPAWDAERFGDLVGAGCIGAPDRDTIPAPAPAFEEDHP